MTGAGFFISSKGRARMRGAGLQMPDRGRPTRYTPEIADLICERLAEGMTLREVCRSEDMPPESTVRLWALEDRDGFSAQYTKAREIGYLALADELLEIADDAANDWMERNNDDESGGWALNGEHVQRSRLRLDTRKWLLSKALPKVYGDKVQNEHSGPDGGPIKTEEIGSGAAKLAAALEKIAERSGTPRDPAAE